MRYGSLIILEFGLSLCVGFLTLLTINDWPKQLITRPNAPRDLPLRSHVEIFYTLVVRGEGASLDELLDFPKFCVRRDR